MLAILITTGEVGTARRKKKIVACRSVKPTIYDTLFDKMKRVLPLVRAIILWGGALSLVLASLAAARLEPRIKLAVFSDKEYGYVFQHPEDWRIQSLPEGKADKNMRVMLQGPNGSSFMVVVEKAAKRITKKEFETIPEQKDYVGSLMSQTIEQIYKRIAQNIKAIDMNVGERRDLSNEVGIKFYVATLHRMQAGKPIIVAGIHAFPFDKDYSINFLMTSSWNGAATEEQEILTAVFNTFHLVGEPRTRDDSGNQPAPGNKPGSE